MNRKVALLICIVMLAGASLGCGVCGLAQKGQQVPATLEAVATEVSRATVPAPAGGTEESGEQEGKEESLDPKSLLGNIETLDSYRSRFTMSYEGKTDSGEVEKWTMTMEMEYVREPFAQRIVLQGGESLGIQEGLETIRIGDQQYTVIGGEGGSCISSPPGEGEAMDTELFKPEDILGGLSRARRAGTETVNGVQCTHYVFDEKDIEGAGFSKAKGDMWVAVDGNYVVKYALDAEGRDPSTNKTGHINWLYEVRDINKPINIQLPAGCSAAGSQYPIMPDATEVTTMGGMVMYKSASSFKDVLQFYQEQMPAKGWSESGEQFVTEDSAWLTYTKDGSSVSVSLSVDESGNVAVMIVEGEQ